MGDKRLIKFDTLQKNCVHRDDWYRDVDYKYHSVCGYIEDNIPDAKLCDIKCCVENCPVWKWLEK